LYYKKKYYFKFLSYDKLIEDYGNSTFDFILILIEAEQQTPKSL